MPDRSNPDDHAFWNTQPVPQLPIQNANQDGSEGPIEAPEPADIKPEPYDLPAGFFWSDIDTGSPDQLEEVYNFLTSNYVEDHDQMFRFDYSKEFLKWALEPPGFKKEWHLSVRTTKKNKLFGMITAIPATMVIKGETVNLVEINFLCVHKKLREKRLAPMLIREITRRCNLHGVFQAAYTAGVVVPQPISDCRYWHRNLNFKKLVEVNFTRLQPQNPMARMIKLYKLPKETSTPNLMPLERKDVAEAKELVHDYLDQFDLRPHWTDEEFAHWFLNRENVITSYVSKDESGKITDFLSFYSLPSNVIDNPLHQTLYVAYSYYNVATKSTLKQLMEDGLIIANQQGHDVFNALELMDNASIFSDLKFGQGDGTLHYYLYNWRIPKMKNDLCGLVLL